MKTNRQLEIIYLLLNKRQRTSEELARHFDVSVKTILRDIDSLKMAGIPVSKQQGINGGIVLSDAYKINKSRLTKTEEAVLMEALGNIKKLPNAQLEYALKMMKQYFNETGTLWVNTDDISLEMQNKFHVIKRAVIEKNVTEFRYYVNAQYASYRAEPYELRIKDDIWKLLVRKTGQNEFEEIYLARMSDIEIKSQRFTRREIPTEYSKKYSREVEEVRFKVLHLTDELLNRFPIECFDISDDEIALCLTLESGDKQNILEKYKGLRFMT